MTLAASEPTEGNDCTTMEVEEASLQHQPEAMMSADTTTAEVVPQQSTAASPLHHHPDVVMKTTTSITTTHHHNQWSEPQSPAHHNSSTPHQHWSFSQPSMSSTPSTASTDGMRDHLLKINVPPQSSSSPVFLAPTRQLKRQTPPPSNTNSLNRRPKRRAAEDTVRRSWGPVDPDEEGDTEFWASIQGPYDYIMTSELLPPHASNDSLVLQLKDPSPIHSPTSLFSAASPLTLPPQIHLSSPPLNPFPVFTLQFPTPCSIVGADQAPAGGHRSLTCPSPVDLSWDPTDIMSTFTDHRQWTQAQLLQEYTHLYEWLLHLEFRWHSSEPNNTEPNSRRSFHSELQKYAYTREMFLEQANRLIKEGPSEAEQDQPHQDNDGAENQTTRVESPKSIPADGNSESIPVGADTAEGQTAKLQHKLMCLNNKWQTLEALFAPSSTAAAGGPGGHPQPSLVLDLEVEEQVLVSWLSGVEEQVPDLLMASYRRSSLSALNDRLLQNQVLLHDIKVHGSFVKNLLKQYDLQTSESGKDSPTPTETSNYQNKLSAESFQQSSTTSALTDFTTTKQTNTIEQQSDPPSVEDFKLILDCETSQSTVLYTPSPSPRDCSSIAAETPRSVETAVTTPREISGTFSTEPSTPRDSSLVVTSYTQTKTNSKKHSKSKGKSSVPKKGKNLEKRYHAVFLKALEWKYYLEQLVSDYREQQSSSGSSSSASCYSVSQSNSSGSEADEPHSKVRRLSCSSEGGSSVRPQSSCTSGREDSSFLEKSSTSDHKKKRTRSVRRRSEVNLTSSGGVPRSASSSKVQHSEAVCVGGRSKWRAESAEGRRRYKRSRVSGGRRYSDPVDDSLRVVPHSEGDLSAAETAGSYIEDDYVCLSEGALKPCCPQSSLQSTPEVPVHSHDLSSAPASQLTSPSSPDTPPKSLEEFINLECEATPSEDHQQANSEAHSKDTDIAMTVLPNDSKMDKENCTNGNVLNNNDSEILGKVSAQVQHQSSPNRAIFEFKHQDTDVEESPQLKRKVVKNLTANGAFDAIVEKEDRQTDNLNLNISGGATRGWKSGGGGRHSWPQHPEPCDESESEYLQNIIDSAIMDPNWLKAASDEDNGSHHEGSDEVQVVETMDTGSEEDQLASSKNAVQAPPKKLDSSIHELVNAAETLVQPTPLPSPIVSPRVPYQCLPQRRSTGAPPKNLAPLHFSDGITASKQRRIQKWLASQRYLPPSPALLDSCDASGEMTTGESDNDEQSESSDSAGADFTHATQIARNLSSHSVAYTPVADKTVSASSLLPTLVSSQHDTLKSTARSRRRRAERRRPWCLADQLQSSFRASNSGVPETHRRSTGSRTISNSTTEQQQLNLSSSNPTLSATCEHQQQLQTCASGAISVRLRSYASDSAICQTLTVVTEAGADNGRSATADAAHSPASANNDVEALITQSNGPLTPATTTPSTSAAIFSPFHSTTNATTTPSTIPENYLHHQSPHSGGSGGGGLNHHFRRRKHKTRRRSNVSLHTRYTDSGSDRAVTAAPDGGPHHLSDCGALTTHKTMGGLVKSSSFAGHPLYVCAAAEAPPSPGSSSPVPSCDKTATDAPAAQQMSPALATSTACCASLKSSSILLRSGVGRPSDQHVTPHIFSVPLTVLSSSLSSDHSDKSPVGSPVKDCLKRGATLAPLLSDRSSKRLSSDAECLNTQEDFSSLSEQAWDPYQENKYLSENYSEDIDTEAAKKFLEFGDDYRRYIDSDGGSSFFSFRKMRGGAKRRDGRIYDRSTCPSDWSLASSQMIESTKVNRSDREVVPSDRPQSDCVAAAQQVPALQSCSVTADGQPSDLLNNTQGDNVRSQGHSSPSDSDNKHNDSVKLNEKLTPTDRTPTTKTDKSGGSAHQLSSGGRTVIRRCRGPGMFARSGDIDSDSDVEDIMTLIEDSRNHLVVAENVLNKHTDEDASKHFMDYSEVLSLCSTNLSALQEVQQQLLTQQQLSSMHRHTITIKGLVQRWENVQQKAAHRQQQSRQLQQIHNNLKQVHLKLDALQQHYTCQTNEARIADIHSLQQLQDRLTVAQARQAHLTEVQAELSELNLSIHKHSTDTGHQLPSLQPQLHHLYQLADTLSHQISCEVSQLSAACKALESWQEQADELKQCLQQDDETLNKLQRAVSGGPEDIDKLQINEPNAEQCSLSSTTKGLVRILTQQQNGSSPRSSNSGGSNARLSDSGTSGYESCSSDDLSERERRLDALKRLASELENTLHPHSLAWTNIRKTISNAEVELSSLQKRCRELLIKTAEKVAPAGNNLCTRVSRRRAAGNQLRINKASRGSPTRRNRSSSRGRMVPGTPRNGWLWRVVRIALPIQAALLLLFCVSCLLEPSCCDSLNTLNFDLGLQVRYIHGKPPV